MGFLSGIIDTDEFDLGLIMDMISDGPGGWMSPAGADFMFSVGSRISFAFDAAGVLGLGEPVFDFGGLSIAVEDFAAANDLEVTRNLPGSDTFDAFVPLGPDVGADGWLHFRYDGPGDYGIDLVPPIPDNFGDDFIFA